MRAARQQSYLEQAKSQVGVGRLFSDREELLRIFGRYTQTDINSEGAILRLLQLTYEATKSPIREVRFPAGIENEPAAPTSRSPTTTCRKTVRQFLELRGSSGAGARKPTTTTPKTSGTSTSSSKKKKSKRIAASLAPGLVAAKTEGEDFVATMSTKAGKLPVYYPAVPARPTASPTRPPTRGSTRSRIAPATRTRRTASSATRARTASTGACRARPGARRRSSTTRAARSSSRGRTYHEYYDGTRLRLIAWRTTRGVYWVSNTLSRTLTNNADARHREVAAAEVAATRVRDVVTPLTSPAS